MSGKQLIYRLLMVVVILGAAYWQRTRPHRNTLPDEGPISREKGSAVLREGPIPGIDEDAPPAKVPPKTLPDKDTHAKAGTYDRFVDARLVDGEGNDGDSFLVRAGGKEFVLRLYFVDAPESYLSDRYAEQRRRVEEQARELGGLSAEQAVEIGKKAKAYTRQQLGNAPFTVYTYWEKVYDGDRYYGFVVLPDGGDLGTRLLEQGLARIHTKGPGSKEKPVPTPQGESFFQARDRLEDIEAQARKEKRGAWAY